MGLGVGLFLALPVGPLSLLCIRRTLDGGSALWWLVLTAVVAATNVRLNTGTLRSLNVALGALIAAFGLAALWGAASRGP